MAVSLDKVKLILIQSTKILSENLRPDPLLPDLMTELAITPDDVDTINREPTDRAKVNKLLGILRTSPVSSYEALMTWLKQNREKDLYPQVKAIQDKHCGTLSEVLKKFPKPPVPPVPAPPILSGNASDKLTDDDIRTITHKSKLKRGLLANLYQELHITDDEIENAEMDAATNDFKLQGGKVLRHWRSTKGKEATKGAILIAMNECDELKEAMELLMGKWTISKENISIV